MNISEQKQELSHWHANVGKNLLLYKAFKRICSFIFSVRNVLGCSMIIYYHKFVHYSLKGDTFETRQKVDLLAGAWDDPYNQMYLQHEVVHPVR